MLQRARSKGEAGAAAASEALQPILHQNSGVSSLLPLVNVPRQSQKSESWENCLKTQTPVVSQSLHRRHPRHHHNPQFKQMKGT